MAQEDEQDQLARQEQTAKRVLLLTALAWGWPLAAV
jgi:hypothetical protein